MCIVPHWNTLFYTVVTNNMPCMDICLWTTQQHWYVYRMSNVGSVMTLKNTACVVKMWKLSNCLKALTKTTEE